VSVPDLAAVRPAPPPSDAERVRARFQGDTPTALLRQVIDSVTKIESGPEAPAGAILDHLDQGGGLLCAGLARLYAATLVANGQEARVVSLSRNFPDRSDSHTTVEVRQDGRWVIFDPTFNLSFIREGVLQGAEEIHRALIDGTASEIHVVRYPPGRYPGRLERQAVHWLPLFNNVYALDPSEGWLAKLPPLRYWLGPRLLLLALPGHPNEHAECLNAVYRGVCVELPAAALALFLLGLAGVLMGWP
jgi:hypothetical protein